MSCHIIQKKEGIQYNEYANGMDRRWGVNADYLEEIEVNDGDACKTSTEQGQKIGITSFKKQNSRGNEYITNMYNRGAQEFILNTVLPQIATALLIDT